MLLSWGYACSGDFAVSLCFCRYFVDSDGIFHTSDADNSAMQKENIIQNHREIKNHDEPESYRKIAEAEAVRNAE